ncbi:MAG TPA: UDP-glucose/GDP-mannose dehydrogenase family protein, partial [Bdellovibrionota bacterium]|nr:UDP-glucose/GDP-mannose dehydrogenase family protein [Bdellovibrionota bacterium]
GAKVRAFDPVALENAKKHFKGRIELLASAPEAARGADALVVVTEWNEFKNPSWDKLKLSMRAPVVFDGRNIYNPATLRGQGFTYFGIGRAKA